MRQLRQMLRLHHDGVSAREIGRTLGVARTTIQDNLKRAAASGLTWPLPPELSDDELEQRLFAHTAIKSGQRRRSEPDWAALARELKRPGVNLMVLWEEYRQAHPEAYGYSRYVAGQELFGRSFRRGAPQFPDRYRLGPCDRALDGNARPCVRRTGHKARDPGATLVPPGAVLRAVRRRMHGRFRQADAGWPQNAPNRCSPGACPA